MSLRLIQPSQDKKSLLTHVHYRHRREKEEEEHKIKYNKIKVNFYSKKQLSLIILENKRWFYKLNGFSI